jgi:hypothetical protein
MERIEALIEFNACRAAQERARAKQAPSQRDRALHEEMAAIFEARADYRRRLKGALAIAP